MTFPQWLAQHLKADTPVGDLARDFKADGCMDLRSLQTEQAQREHLEEHGAMQAALDAHAEAWQQYREQAG